MALNRPPGETAEMQPAFPLRPYQHRAVYNPARFTWNCWSRQTGKSTVMALRRLMRGLERKRNQILLSAGERASRELMVKVKQHVQALKIGFEWREHEMFEGTTFKQLEIAIPERRMRVIGLPANPNTARGFTGDLLLDEFSTHRDSREIWGAAYATITYGKGELDVCGTPKGRQNMFYALQQNDVFSHDTVTIHDAIADGLEEDAEVLRKGLMDEELWRQEYLCEFVDEATAFLTYEQICECEKQDLPRELDLDELRSLKGDAVVGIDIGRKHDLTVIWAFAVREHVMESLGMFELPKMSFREQFEAASNVICQRCVRRCAVDASGLGMQLAEDLVTRFGDHTVEACTLSGPFKEQIASRMRNRFIDKLIRIPVDERIRNDLHSVRKTVTSAGNVRLDAPREEGSHADRFWAAALACHAAAEEGGPRDAVFGPALISAGMIATVGDDDDPWRGLPERPSIYEVRG